MPSIIIGTAGHIDHGKSALVRALTGTDPDRLPEEKKRGITIDLGFADLTLDDMHFGFVDVPGHERFIKNMLAGAHGIDLLMLVVAADESVMPQTREHFDICRLLGVRQGIIVITKKDLVEDELLALVEDEVSELVAGSFLEGAPIVAVSSRTGEGIERLKEQLKIVSQSVPPKSGDFITRLPVDRAFSMRGFGAVVTGTLISGAISEGDELELLPLTAAVRVRGTQVHGAAVATAEAGQRTAVNLAGVDVKQLERGMVLAPVASLRPTQIIDASVNVLTHASRGLRSRARVRLHIGSTEVLARIRILDGTELEPGQTGLAQLRLEAPVVALHDDHFILRSYSPAETIAGGIVLDPFAIKHRGKDLEKTRERLKMLIGSDREVKLAALTRGSGIRGSRRDDLRAATGWTTSVLSDVIVNAQKRKLVVDAAGIVLTPEAFSHLRQSVVEELEGHHRKEPLARGMLRETLREKIFSQSLPEVFIAVIADLENQGTIVSEKDVVRLGTHSVDLSEKDIKLRNDLENSYLTAGAEAPTVDEVMTRIGVTPKEKVNARKVLQLLIDNATIIRLQGEMFMHTSAVDQLKSKLFDFASKNEPERLIDVAAFKDLAGVSRKYAIPLLEYFDREHITRRAGDKRLILRSR